METWRCQQAAAWLNRGCLKAEIVCKILWLATYEIHRDGLPNVHSLMSLHSEDKSRKDKFRNKCRLSTERFAAIDASILRLSISRCEILTENKTALHTTL